MTRKILPAITAALAFTLFLSLPAGAVKLDYLSISNLILETKLENKRIALEAKRTESAIKLDQARTAAVLQSLGGQVGSLVGECEDGINDIKRELASIRRKLNDLERGQRR